MEVLETRMNDLERQQLENNLKTDSEIKKIQMNISSQLNDIESKTNDLQNTNLNGLPHVENSCISKEFSYMISKNISEVIALSRRVIYLEQQVFQIQYSLYNGSSNAAHKPFADSAGNKVNNSVAAADEVIKVEPNDYVEYNSYHNRGLDQPKPYNIYNQYKPNNVPYGEPTNSLDDSKMTMRNSNNTEIRNHTTEPIRASPTIKQEFTPEPKESFNYDREKSQMSSEQMFPSNYSSPSSMLQTQNPSQDATNNKLLDPDNLSTSSPSEKSSLEERKEIPWKQDNKESDMRCPPYMMRNGMMPYPDVYNQYSNIQPPQDSKETYPQELKKLPNEILCLHCEFKTSTDVESKQNEILTHMRESHPDKILNCQMCDYQAPSRDKLRIHMKRSHVNRPFNCKFCEYKAKRPDVLRNHVNAIHQRNKRYGCPSCKYRTITQGLLNWHYKRDCKYASMGLQQPPSQEQPFPNNLLGFT